MKKNIGYLPNMADAKTCIHSILGFYQQERGNQAFQKFFEEQFGSKSESTLRLTQNTLVNYGLIRETEDYVFETTELGKKWLQNPTYEFLVSILNDRVEFIGELLQELEKKPCFADELLQKAAENYGFELGGSDLSRRMQILKAAEIVKMNRRKQYSITEKGRAFLEKIDRKKMAGIVDGKLESCDGIDFKQGSRYGSAFQETFRDVIESGQDSHDEDSEQLLQSECKTESEIDKMSQKSDEKDTKWLYYSCSVQDFLDIIKNHRYRFWGFHTEKNLDAMEKIKINVIEKVRATNMGNTSSDSSSKILDTLEQFTDKILDTIECTMKNDRVSFRFVMELEQNTRHLRQRNENNDGEAVIALAFDSRELETLLCGRGHLEQGNNDRTQEADLEAKMEFLKNRLLVRYGAYNEKPENEEQIIKQTADEFWNEIIRDILSHMDGYGNTDKKKTRLILEDAGVNLNNPVWDMSCELLVKNGRIVPCRYMDEKTVGKFPLKRVILGPGCKMSPDEVSRWISFCGFRKERIEILKETGQE